MEIVLNPIGYIESPFKDKSEIPKQSIYAKDKRAKLVLDSKYKDGLYTLKPGDYIVVLFNFHMAPKEKELKFIHHSEEIRGVFNTRSPNRPNDIGMSIVEIKSIDNNVVEIMGVDMLDGTPILDIKPYASSLNPE